MSKLPMETKPIKMNPDRAVQLEKMLAPYSGKPLAAAQKAVLAVYQSKEPRSEAQWMADYQAAIAEAVKEKEPEPEPAKE